MDWFDHVIVGSGPSGVAAARRLMGRDLCLLDVGVQFRGQFPYATLNEAICAGDISALLGANWEMLANLVEPARCHPKLRAAALRHVMSGEPFRVCDAAGATFLRGAGSHAAGGMSNAWGAQLMRYTDADLAESGGWPLGAAVFERYYSDLEEHIGISGSMDDLQEFLGPCHTMQPPAAIVPAAERLYSRFQIRKNGPFKSALLLGRPRLAIATRPHCGRALFEYGETEFFNSHQPGIYTARYTLDELISRGLNYLPGRKLLAYRESAQHVELDVLDMSCGQRQIIRTGHLLLACGTVQTARLVLINKGERGRSLPFMDHPPTLLPIFQPAMFGSALPEQSFPVQLVGTMEATGKRDMISFYYPGGMLWSDLIPDIPLPFQSAMGMLAALLGGMLVAQIWETSRPSVGNRIRLDESGEIVIDYPDRTPYPRLPQLLKALRQLGAYSAGNLARMASPGWGFHYAGCLPMRKTPDAYETHLDGRLWDSKRVRAIDGSVLPSLPAKNHSLTMMANAARIADEVARCGY